MGLNCLKDTEPLQEGSLLFTTKIPEIPGAHFDRPWKDEKLPEVLKLGPMDWEASTLTTGPLLHEHESALTIF